MEHRMDLETVWADYRLRLKAFLHSRVSNAMDVEDLLQEISIKVLNGLPFLDDKTKLQPWLFQTAHRTILDHYRKQGRGKAIHADDLWYEGDGEDVRDDLERCVEPFISALPEDQAALLQAIDLEGMSQKAYAVAHGLTYSTLKSRVQKARARLRGLFEECCHLTVDARGSISDYQQKSGGCKKC